MIERLRHKGWAYWLINAAIMTATMLGRGVIDDRLNLKDAKNKLFVLLTQSPTNPSYAHDVKLIAIDDDAFWSDAMQHRSPTNRIYLARLIAAADAAEARVIALDFDLRLGQATASVSPGRYDAIEPAYRKETDVLMRIIGNVAQRRHIVLAEPIGGPIDGPFHLLPAAQNAYGICIDLLGGGRWGNPGTPRFPLTSAARRNISCGYIALMDDARRLPPPARIVGSRNELDSFSLAIARARDAAAPARIGRHAYASFITADAIRAPGTSLPAVRALADPIAARDLLQGNAVVIGAVWHTRSYGQGDAIDLHDTPIGSVAGALLHLNLAEAVLGNRVYPAMPEWAMLLIEIALSIGAAVLFALMPSAALAMLLLAASMVMLLGIQWIFLQLFGTFLDLIAPTVGMGVHAIIERLVSRHP